MHNQLKEIDTKELELPDTVFIRDIETKVFQSIILQCLSQIEGVALVDGNLIDSLFKRPPEERVSGIHVEQDQKTHSVKVKVEVNIAYGLSIPEKAEEIQMKITQDISKLTALHVGAVHVVFKNLITKPAAPEKTEEPEREYSDELS
jgi:uncharacterized alkaline shock family protein YloU